MTLIIDFDADAVIPGDGGCIEARLGRVRDQCFVPGIGNGDPASNGREIRNLLNMIRLAIEQPSSIKGQQQLGRSAQSVQQRDDTDPVSKSLGEASGGASRGAMHYTVKKLQPGEQNT
jgi:hypothetical protein